LGVLGGGVSWGRHCLGVGGIHLPCTLSFWTGVSYARQEFPMRGVSLMTKFSLAAMLGLAVGGGAKVLPAPAVDLPSAAESEKTRTAVFAGGCFWCTEVVFEQLEGVSEVVSGYVGDVKANANYEQVSAGVTKHAEAIRITYDPGKITYGQLLQVFFSVHDPTTKDRQGPDWGHQYRSAVFFANEEEKKVATAYIEQLGAAKSFEKPIVTTVEPMGDGFFDAEKYHQDYVKHNPGNPYVRVNALPKVEKVRELFPERIKK
jgi:peptide-methionine (S)-S-oxide reductase